MFAMSDFWAGPTLAAVSECSSLVYLLLGCVPRPWMVLLWMIICVNYLCILCHLGAGSLSLWIVATVGLAWYAIACFAVGVR